MIVVTASMDVGGKIRGRKTNYEAIEEFKLEFIIPGLIAGKREGKYWVWGSSYR